MRRFRTRVGLLSVVLMVGTLVPAVSAGDIDHRNDDELCLGLVPTLRIPRTGFTNLPEPVDVDVDEIAGIVRITGSRGPDIILIEDGIEDTLLIKGRGGDDIICGGDGDEILLGQGGDDILIGDRGKDRLKGGKGTDVLFGEGGADRLNGGRGDDSCDGGGSARDRTRKCEEPSIDFTFLDMFITDQINNGLTPEQLRELRKALKDGPKDWQTEAGGTPATDPGPGIDEIGWFIVRGSGPTNDVSDLFLMSVVLLDDEMGPGNQLGFGFTSDAADLHVVDGPDGLNGHQKLEVLDHLGDTAFSSGRIFSASSDNVFVFATQLELCLDTSDFCSAGVSLFVRDTPTGQQPAVSDPTAFLYDGVFFNPSLLDDVVPPGTGVYDPFIDPNADVDHVRVLSGDLFGVEDLFGLGDADFDDVVLVANFNAVG